MRNTISGLMLPIISTAFFLNLSNPALPNSFDVRAKAERVVFRVGFPASAVSKAIQQEMRVALEVWGSKLAERGTETISRVEAIIFEDEDFSDIYDSLKRKELDCLIMNSLDFVEYERSKLMEPVFVGFSGERIGHEYVLLVRHDSGIESLEGLKKGTINIETEGVGRMPLVWLEVLLSSHGLPDMSEFFKEIQYMEKASQTVLPVFFSKVNAGLTNMRAFRTMVELNPQLERELAVLGMSSPFLRGVIVYRKDLAQDIKESVYDAMRTMHEDPDGEQILIVMREQKLIPYKQEYTDTVRTLYKDYQLHILNAQTGNSEDK